jgi:tRNA pseudouridine55 synthase
MRAGVLVVDKPRGPTSHDVVARLRKLLKTREIGHAGTLDPMATGVLVLAIGEGTKLVPWLAGAEKEYEARLELGRATDTLDAEGKLATEQPVDPQLFADDLRIERALQAELARTSQVPPSFSAIHHQGERAHVLARRGEEVLLEPRAVQVHRLEVTGKGWEPRPWLSFRVRADKGYYVRSLGRDLAHELGTVGHLTELRRVASGSFTLADAVPLGATREELEARVLRLADAAKRALPQARLSEAGVRAAGFGQPVRIEDIEGTRESGVPTAWFDGEGALVAVGVVEEDVGRVKRGFVAR